MKQFDEHDTNLWTCDNEKSVFMNVLHSASH